MSTTEHAASLAAYWIMGLRPRGWLSWLGDNDPAWRWQGIDQGRMIWIYTTAMIRLIELRAAVPVGSRTVAILAADDRWRWSQIIEGATPDQIAIAFYHAGPRPPDPRPGAIPIHDMPYDEWVQKYHMYDWAGTLAELQRRAEEEAQAAREWSSAMPATLSVRAEDLDPAISCPRCQASIRLDGAFEATSVEGTCDRCGVQVEYCATLVLGDPRAE